MNIKKLFRKVIELFGRSEKPVEEKQVEEKPVEEQTVETIIDTVVETPVEKPTKKPTKKRRGRPRIKKVSLPGEEWRPVESMPEYEVSSKGRVCQVDTFEILCHRRSRGRLYYVLSDKYISIYKLMADTFCYPPKLKDNESCIVNVKNGDPSDLRLDNLIFSIACYNNKGRYLYTRKEDCILKPAPKIKPKPAPIIEEKPAPKVKPKGRQVKLDMTIGQYRPDGTLIRMYLNIDDVIKTHRNYDRSYFENLLESGEPDDKNFIWKKIENF